MLLKGAAEGAAYSITMTVASTDGSPRPSSVLTTVTVFPGNGPAVAIQAPPAQALNPALKLSLAGRVSSYAPPSSLHTAWTLVEGVLSGGPFTTLSTPGIVRARASSHALPLPPPPLTPRARCRRRR